MFHFWVIFYMTYMYAYIDIYWNYIDTYEYIYVYTYVYIYVYTYTYIYVHVYV